ncbi:hypothetical protein E1212_14175 [Jiangella ureilytica]|uniref:Uncharacterized protein n=1 Tax=Jiangella ureilytica TaxID=2530374 RepID=A0A4V6PB37_9ACTN|nr:hypothetical protein [Jiangella ureilytica]TDC50705.1 hypothetical protein E1212_14175 [Jiangella ureilytica]
MEWLMTMTCWAPFGPCPHPAAPDTPAPSPGELDLRLIRVAYEVAVTVSPCVRCGAALDGPRLSMRRAGWSHDWQVAVVVRCRGWRRHRHTAVATEAAGELRLGALQARTAGGES